VKISTISFLYYCPPLISQVFPARRPCPRSRVGQGRRWLIGQRFATRWTYPI